MRISTNSESNYAMAAEWLKSPVPADGIEYFKELCENLGVDVIENPTQADFANARVANFSRNSCANCRGRLMNRGTCFKYLPYIEGNRLRVEKRICNVADVRAIIDVSHIPKIFNRMRLKNFIFADKNPCAVKVAESCINDNVGAYFYGDVGTGKTMLSSIIVVERALLGKTALFYTVTDMLDELRNFSDNVARLTKLNKVKTCPCLVIDDLGVEDVTDWVGATLFEILDARYKANLCTVINSNFSLTAAANRYGSVHGARIARRISELCVDVFMVGSN